jgi:flagellar motor switch/type III secretory pathway protein FliN
MSDEQPTFKVTDRRLFNADGSPRDLPPEERPEPPLEPVETVTANAASATAAAGAQTQAATAAPPPSEASSETGAEAEVEFTEEELADARDPAGFLSFVMSIASNAASALGMMEHPVTHQREVDVELGKHWIDVLGMLQKKTAGNLSPKEQQMLEGLLADLRMQYVSLTSAAPQAQRFSGSDITGGR